MYRGRLRSRRGAATANVSAEASISDILHLPECVEPILRALLAPDLLNLATSSRACRAATSLSYIQLDINSAAGLRAVKGLHRLGCLHHLRQAKLTAAVSDSVAGGHLALLAACPQLAYLVLVDEFKPAKLWWWQQHIDGVTQYGGLPCEADSAHEKADSAFLHELATAMPVNTHRRFEKLEPAEGDDAHYYCSQRWLDDCHCGFPESQRYLWSLRHSHLHSDDNHTLQAQTVEVTRCACFDKVWSWQPGQQAHIYRIV